MAHVLVREERPSDREAVRRVNEEAFGQPAEADIVDALRSAGAAAVSLVAEMHGEVVGHILFSPVVVERSPPGSLALGLAPMAVLPAHQSRGVGTLLVREGLACCRRLRVSFVVVLGHPSYYPRFGFETASRYRLRCEFEAADEAFMVLEIEPGALLGASGTVSYHEAFRLV